MRRMGARIAAPAKVNLWLDVHGRDASGFHPVDTLFCALGLSDTVEVEPLAQGVELRVSGADVGPTQSNLVWRAAWEFMRVAQLDVGVRLTLVKRIPAGAGLGGGSSDAAAALRVLAALHGSPLGPTDLRRIGAALGSDVSFFLGGSALARGRGYGEVLEPLPALRSMPVLIAVPPVPMPTAEAYRLFDEARAAHSRDAPGHHSALSWDEVARSGGNDFEPVIVQRMPELGQALTELRRAGALTAGLAGSGSAVFAIFADERDRDGVASRLVRELPEFHTCPTHTLVQLPYVEAVPVPA